MKLYIKNMVCVRCKMVVKQELLNLGLHYVVVELGSVEILEDITDIQKHQLKIALYKSGLELIENRRSILIEKIKNAVLQLINEAHEPLKVNFSNHLSDKLNHNYTYLANLFSEREGMTIEHYNIVNKIEKVKELLIYDELTLTEISYKLHYSSVAHLSSQFKKITGLTPSFFKNVKNHRMADWKVYEKQIQHA